MLLAERAESERLRQIIKELQRHRFRPPGGKLARRTAAARPGGGGSRLHEIKHEGHRLLAIVTPDGLMLGNACPTGNIPFHPALCAQRLPSWQEADRERLDLSRRFDRRRSGHPVFLRFALTARFKMQTSEPVIAAPTRVDLIHWSPAIGGALVAAALSVVLISFGAALGLSVASTAPTWRDTSAIAAIVSGLYLILTALVSFGFGGYIAGRLRSTWHTTLHHDFAEFRDGTHGLLAWAIAVLISGLVAAALSGIAASSSKSMPATSPAATTGEALFPYDLDRLFRSDRRDRGDVAYSRAEASRILLTANSHQGLKPDDRTYLAGLVANHTGIGQPEAERRTDDVIAAAKLAVKRARQSAVILGFSIAVSLLLGAAAAWYAACLGAQHRDQTAPPLRWNLSRA